MSATCSGALEYTDSVLMAASAAMRIVSETKVLLIRSENYGKLRKIEKIAKTKFKRFEWKGNFKAAYWYTIDCPLPVVLVESAASSASGSSSWRPPRSRTVSAVAGSRQRRATAMHALLTVRSVAARITALVSALSAAADPGPGHGSSVKMRNRKPSTSAGPWQ